MPALRLGICCAAALAGALAANPPNAQADFAVGPTVVDMRAKPGAARSGTFDVHLDGERGRRFAVLAEAVTQTRAGAFVYRRPTSSGFSASRWVQVFPRTFSGTPDRSQVVEYRVRVPQGAEPGDHVTSLTVRRLPPRGARGSVAVQAVSVRLTVRVPGEIREQVKVGTPDVPSVAGKGPVHAKVDVRNRGNVTVDFAGANTGSLAILDDGRPKARVRFKGILLPGQGRSFEVAWQDPPALGKFDARASVRTGEGTITESRSFWMLPWRQAGALVLFTVAVLVLLGGGRGLRRKRSKAAAE